MSVTVTPAEPEDADAVPEPPAVPWRPLPPGMARRVRRRAGRDRLRHVCASLGLAGAAVAGLLLALPTPGERGGLPPAPVDPTPLWAVEDTGPPTPRVEVGLGGAAWPAGSWAGLPSSAGSSGAAWCLGSVRDVGPPAAVTACRFLPTPGRMDTAVLDPGVYAPAGQRLVVAILVGQGLPTPAVSAELRDPAGSRAMRLDRPPGVPGVAYVWTFSTGGPVSITVYDGNGDLVASCAACTDGGL